MDGYLAYLLALAEDPQDALARREAGVVDIEPDGLADARPGVEEDTREGPVARRQVRLDRAEPAQNGALVECPRCLGGQVSALGVGATQATSMAASALFTVPGAAFATACRWER